MREWSFRESHCNSSQTTLLWSSLLILFCDTPALILQHPFLYRTLVLYTVKRPKIPYAFQELVNTSRTVDNLAFQTLVGWQSLGLLDFAIKIYRNTDEPIPDRLILLAELSDETILSRPVKSILTLAVTLEPFRQTLCTSSYPSRVGIIPGRPSATTRRRQEHKANFVEGGFIPLQTWFWTGTKRRTVPRFGDLIEWPQTA